VGLDPLFHRFRVTDRGDSERLFPQYFLRETAGNEKWIRLRPPFCLYPVYYPLRPADAARHRYHRRDFYQVVFVVGGSGSLAMRREPKHRALSTGEVLFLEPLLDAHFLPGARGLRMASYSFRPSALGYPDEILRERRLAEAYPLLQAFAPRETGPVAFRPSPSGFSTLLFHAFHGLEEFHRDPFGAVPPLILRLLLEWLAPRLPGNPSPKNRDSAVAGARIYLNEHFRERQSLASLSARFRLSPTYFSRRFNEETGMGLQAFLNRLRVAEARRLLVETRLPIHRIAGEVGYGSVGHFNAVFRDLMGRTPGACRAGRGGRGAARPHQSMGA